MQVSKRDSIIISLMSIAIGALFIILKGQVISIAMTAIGVLLIVNGIIHIVKDSDKVYGIILLCVGILIIVGGWLITTVILYILAVLFIIYGLLAVFAFFRGANVNVLYLIAPILMIVAGVLLFFNQKGTIDWVFIVEGIVLIVEGLFNLLSVLFIKEA